MIDDTIVALASPPGAADRAVLRLSGPRARRAAGAVLGGALAPRRGAVEGRVLVLGEAVECLALVMPAPASYTGEDVVELHLPGAPLLVEHVVGALLASGDGEVRPATPGEFTRRAFVNRRLDLAEAEAVLALIHAAGDDARRRAAAILSGGLAAGVTAARARIQDALALLEAGLDFTDGETGQVDAASWVPLLAQARTALAALRDQLPAAAPGGELLVLGAANAGKSSLCNALAGEERVIVSAREGTTRDTLSIELAGAACLLDGPGDPSAPPGTVDTAALALRERVATRAGGALLVLDATAPRSIETALPIVAVIVTKVDLVPAPALPADLPAVPRFAVSSVTGAGLAQLRTFLAGVGRGPSGHGQRAGQLLARAERALARALDTAAAGGGEELVAVDLAAALAALDDLHGRSSPEDLLDRIFGAFCLGK